MDKKREPDPRFQEFTESLDQDGKPIGFTLTDNDFLFKYDRNGGWVDENGHYFNAEGILQSEEEDSDEDSLDERDDDIVDEFEDMLRQEEQGIIRKPAPKEEEKPVVKEQKKPVPAEQKKPEPVAEQPQNKADEFDYKSLLQRYQSKQLIRENLPGELFIYFKQRSQYYDEIKPSVQSKQSTQEKNKQIGAINLNIKQKRDVLLKEHEWLAEAGVSLDYSGESEEQNIYQRYWYGHIRTEPDRYLSLLEKIQKDKHFYLLSYKTFYSLKSKFYLKKAQQKVKEHIKQLQGQISKMTPEQAVLLRLDNLPEHYPLSFVYDLVEFVGGKWEDIEQAHGEDEFSAELLVLRDTAIKMVNLQAYNHDKGEYVELSIQEIKDRVSKIDKHRFYWIEVENQYKIHERELYDTLGLTISKEDLAKHNTAEQYAISKVRFAVGSIAALKKVLFFRGPSLNTIHVWADPKGSK